MFPTQEQQPLRIALRRGLDLAVEFATLGEYPLRPCDDDGRPGEGELAVGNGPAVYPRVSAVRPASAAARRRIHASAGPHAGSPVRTSAPICAPPDRILGGRTKRSRQGAAEPPPQSCLAAEGG
jgi:hypothetical protein